jgi:membrane associated rhomboid family serine protease
MMFEQSDDHRPVMYVRGHGLYATHVIIAVYVLTMLVCTVVGPQVVHSLMQLLAFDSYLVHHGQVWRIFTYGLVNPPTIGFVIDMVVMFWFGREVERFFGRRVFLTFYCTLYLLTPLVFTVLGFLRPMMLVGETGALAIFIAFATLYPNALMLFGIAAKWWAGAVVAIQTLMLVFARDAVGLCAFWVPVAFAFGFVRYQQGRFTLPSVAMPSFRRRPKFRVLPPAAAESHNRDEPASEVDDLLDKIAKSGIDSLTTKERARLEKAREELMKRETR